MQEVLQLLEGLNKKKRSQYIATLICIFNVTFVHLINLSFLQMWKGIPIGPYKLKVSQFFIIYVVIQLDNLCVCIDEKLDVY
jgi:hypothetical protein